VRMTAMGGDFNWLMQNQSSFVAPISAA